MTYIGIYISEKGIAVITDSQASTDKEKDDFCQKLYTIGGNFVTGTGLGVVIQETAKGLERMVGNSIVSPEELAQLALKIGLKTYDFSDPRAETHIHVSGRHDGLVKGGNGRGDFRIYAVVLAYESGIADAGKVLFDGSGSASVAEALERDLQKGIIPFIHRDLDDMLGFLYDTGMEAPESPGVNMEFQFGFSDGNNIAAVYDPNVDVILPPKMRAGKKFREHDDPMANKADFNELVGLLRQRYALRARYNEANESLLYGENGHDIERIKREYDGAKRKTIKYVSRMIDAEPMAISSRQDDKQNGKTIKIDVKEALFMAHSSTIFSHKG